MKKAALLRALAFLSISLLPAVGKLGSCQAPDDSGKAAKIEREARIVQEHGEVFVRPSGQTNYFPALVDSPLEAGDTVQTGADGECDIAMDGSSLLHLEKGTEFNLASLDQRDSAFTVSVGGLLGKLVGSKGQPANMEFRTPTAWGGLRGTEIGIETTGRQSRFGVFDEGKLAVHQDGAEVLLTPRTELEAQEGKPLGQAREMQALLSHAQGMGELRKNRDAIEKAWRPMDPSQRQARRRQLLSQKPVSANKAAKMIQRAQKKMQDKFRTPAKWSSHPSSRRR